MNNLRVLIIGPRGIGKSNVYKEISPKEINKKGKRTF